MRYLVRQGPALLTVLIGVLATSTAHPQALPSSRAPAAAESSSQRQPTTERAAISHTRSAKDGMRGLWEVHTAGNGRPSELVVALSASFSRSLGLLIDGDVNTLQRQGLALAYTFDAHWAVSGSVSQRLNHNSFYRYEAARVLGDPAVAVQYNRILWPRLGVAGRLHLGVPTAALTPGLAFKAMSAGISGLATWTAYRELQLTANVGFTLDGRNNLFSDPVRLNQAQRFAAAFPASSRFPLGAGATYDFVAGDIANLAPWLEISSEMAPGVAPREWPSVINLGVQGLPNHARRWELNLGMQVRLGGGPRNNAHFGGLPPWTLFGLLAIHSLSSDANDTVPL